MLKFKGVYQRAAILWSAGSAIAAVKFWDSRIGWGLGPLKPSRKYICNARFRGAEPESVTYSQHAKSGLQTSYILRQSEFKDEAKYTEAIHLAKAAKGKYEDAYKTELFV